jgi:DNA (cytosine-5)-methyltransferase 1
MTRKTRDLASCEGLLNDKTRSFARARHPTLHRKCANVAAAVLDKVGPTRRTSAGRRSDPHDALHEVPRWNDMQLFCMTHTGEGCTAFDNSTCVACGTETADRQAWACASCGEVLPRPVKTVRRWRCSSCQAVAPWSARTCPDGHSREATCAVTSETRLVKAFRTSYRRMHGGRPAATLTTNSGVISSDVKGHPRQDRVLSVREVLIVASVGAAGLENDDLPWKAALRTISDLPHRLIREICGESIPPLLASALVKHLLQSRAVYGVSDVTLDQPKKTKMTDD